MQRLKLHLQIKNVSASRNVSSCYRITRTALTFVCPQPRDCGSPPTCVGGDSPEEMKAG